MSNEEHFEGITKELLEIYKKKNHDYGNSWEEELNEFGTMPAVIRIKEKYNRLKTSATKVLKVEDETPEDTLLDIANYCIMTVMWIRDKQKE